MGTTIASPAAALSHATGQMETRGVNVDEARYRLGGLGKTAFYDLVRQGKIRTVKIGGRRVVPMSEIHRLLSGDDSK